MSAIVDFPYYKGTYMGMEADQASFPALNAHATRIIDALTHWQVTENSFSELDSLTQTQYKLAVCSQVDFLAINGLDEMNSGESGGWTVGKVTVHGSGNNSGKSGAMSAYISPVAILYLEQSGLMNPGVGVVQC